MTFDLNVCHAGSASQVKLGGQS